ncbi:MAG: hypothetical protein NTZ16_13195 [Verrucomicrobia bacterium]|nr:hypothetical protein [Verrucomicrobiota bacterium]
MARRDTPNSIPTIQRALEVARDAYRNTPNPAARAISPEQFAQLDPAQPANLLNRLLAAQRVLSTALAAQANATIALETAAARLTMFVSHFHQVLDLGVTRGAFGLGARGYYGRPVDSYSLPDLGNYDALLDAAERVVAGEAARAVGEAPAFNAMSAPTAAEVGTHLEPYRAALRASRSAREKTDFAREAVQALFPAALELAVDICDTVEFFHRKDAAAASRRAKCARWGVVYRYAPNETPPPVG